MTEYSDTTEQVFRRAIDALQGEIPESTLRKLRELFDAGEIHDPKQLSAALKAKLDPETELVL